LEFVGDFSAPVEAGQSQTKSEKHQHETKTKIKAIGRAVSLNHLPTNQVFN